ARHAGARPTRSFRVQVESGRATEPRHAPCYPDRAVRVLITGVTGMAGSHLAEYLLAEHPDVAVYGAFRWRSRMENLEPLRRAQKVDIIEGRYSDGQALRDEKKKGRVTLLYSE